MLDDSELSEDEEEFLIYVEFDGLDGTNPFADEKLQLDMIGLDMDNPIMQVNGKFYEGTYEDAVGTYMFFEKDDNPTVDDPVFDRVSTLKYYNKTRKVLKMQRVFTMPRTEVLGDSSHEDCVPNMDTLREAGVPPKYQNEALQFWSKMRDSRMEALDAYLEKHRIREEKKSRGIVPDSESDEDNPFAMYKPQSHDISSKERRDKSASPDLDALEALSLSKDESDDSFENEPVRSTVIDPGPSTSKDSTPWVAPPKRKQKATIKVKLPMTKKALKAKNEAKRKKSKMSKEERGDDVHEKEHVHMAELSENISMREIKVGNIAGPTEMLDVKKISQKFEGMTNPPSPARKKLERQAKRESKMKEISEKLKRLREESLKKRESENAA